jgi:hypothetical protein
MMVMVLTLKFILLRLLETMASVGVMLRLLLKVSENQDIQMGTLLRSDRKLYKILYGAGLRA